MKSIEELQKLFDTELKPNLETLEHQRKSLKKKTIMIIAIVVFFALGILGAQYVPELGIIMFLVFPGIIVIGYLAYKIYTEKGKYRSEFKETVVRKIVELINPDWDYEATGHISHGHYKTSKLFPRSVDRYKGDDLVSGAIEKTDFRISELHTEYKSESTDSEGRRETTWHTIFKGLFAHIDFNKDIKGETMVLPDTAEKMFGSFGKRFQKMSGRGKLIQMENVEFEKEFVVYGSDQIEARYILTPTMMEAILNLAKQFGKKVQFSFIGSRVYFAMEFKKDLFEPRIMSSGIQFEDMKRMNDQFSIIETIIHEMNLNTRIWTKE